jgi:hypothetical protein
MRCVSIVPVPYPSRSDNHSAREQGRKSTSQRNTQDATHPHNHLRLVMRHDLALNGPIFVISNLRERKEDICNSPLTHRATSFAS